MKHIGLMVSLWAALFFCVGATIWEGSAAVSANGELPDKGICIATGVLPQNTVVDITNPVSGKTVRGTVAGNLRSRGVLALLSREAAEQIGISRRSGFRIRISLPQEAPAGTNAVDTKADEPNGVSADTAAVEPNAAAAPPSAASGSAAAEIDTELATASAGKTDTGLAMADAGQGDIARKTDSPLDERDRDGISSAAEKVEIPAGERPVAGPVKEPADGLNGEPSNKAAARPAEKPPEKPAVRSSERPADWPYTDGSYEFSLVPAEERPPQAPPEPNPPIAATPESEKPPPAETAASASPKEKRLPVPLVKGLERGKYYLQLGAFSSMETAETEAKRIGDAYPLAVQDAGSPGRPLYRVLIGPVSSGESAALLQRFKGSGYWDAFIRRGNL